MPIIVEASRRRRSVFRTAYRPSVIAGALGSVTSTLALMIAARAAGKGALQPTNATSHWLNGDRAAEVRQADLQHTAVGYGTHHAATVFWAFLFETWALKRRARPPTQLLGGAAVVSAVAAIVDYRATPKRFTPGWEFVLSRPSMGLAYAAMAVGLAAGAALGQPAVPKSRRAARRGHPRP